jgi:hypothetical protein
MAKTSADIRSLARSHTATAVRTLAGIMKERRAPAAARVSAAIAVLDRGWGKPQQAIEMDWRQKPPDQMTDEELIALIREMESLTSRANNGHS